MFLALLACGSTLPEPLPNEPRVVYEFVHERWTRELHLHKQFETQVVVKATLLTEELARAQALTVSRARFEDPASYAERRDAAIAESEAHWVVVFTGNAPPPRYADTFALDDSADWQIHLEADGRRVDPVDLERIWEPTADQELLYLQLDRWSKLWVARFEKPSAADRVDLLVVGPYGHGKMSWPLR